MFNYKIIHFFLYQITSCLVIFNKIEKIIGQMKMPMKILSSDYVAHLDIIQFLIMYIFMCWLLCISYMYRQSIMFKCVKNYTQLYRGRAYNYTQLYQNRIIIILSYYVYTMVTLRPNQFYTYEDHL